MKQGKASVRFERNVYMVETASIAGKKEGQGPLAQWIDQIEEDSMVGTDTWEKAESALQSKAAQLVIDKTGINKSRIRYIFGGDLLGQSIATSFGIMKLQIPLFGLYGACSTMGESLALGSLIVGADYADYVLCVTSSHFASAEKQFRFPLDYGNQRPYAATWTVTGSGAVILGNQTGFAKIIGITTGKIVDMGIKDSMNMGAAMAPAAFDTIYRNFLDFGIDGDYYDKIITGDLGSVGKEALLNMLKQKGYDIADKYMDCGMEMYNPEDQDTHAGGSGCGCAAVTLCSMITNKLKEKEWNRILFVPTGALLSPTSFNEGQSIPGIAHAVMIERVKEVR
ncbi:MAG: stage V sporulation protein AD [Lachnospiraceae bacterium]